MIYQKLLVDNPAYLIFSSKNMNYIEHRHSELEITFCVSGEFSVIIDKKTYNLKEGQMVIVGPMVSHEYKGEKRHKAVTVEVGSVFLGEYYKPFLNAPIKEPCFDLVSGNNHPALVELFKESYALSLVKNDVSMLLNKGNAYKISAYVLRDFIPEYSEKNSSASLMNIEMIHNALEYIRNNSKDDIKVEDIAAKCGYSECNFCKTFKNITGATFHATLNQQRVSNACALLKGASMPLDTIAAEVGFSDAKSLCRVFKKVMGVTPGQYRKTGI